MAVFIVSLMPVAFAQDRADATGAAVSDSNTGTTDTADGDVTDAADGPDEGSDIGVSESELRKRHGRRGAFEAGREEAIHRAHAANADADRSAKELAVRWGPTQRPRQRYHHANGEPRQAVPGRLQTHRPGKTSRAETAQQELGLA